MFYLTEDDVQWLRQLRATVRGIAGDGVSNDGHNIRISQKPAVQRVAASAPRNPVLALTGSAARPGVYTGVTTSLPATPFDPTLAAAWTTYDICTPLTTAVYMINLAEEYKLPSDPSPHDLIVQIGVAPQLFEGILNIGAHTDGNPIWLFNGYQALTCT